MSKDQGRAHRFYSPAKIEDGTREPAWSVDGTAEDEDDGRVQGYQNHSVTLVRNPALEEATYSVAAAKQAVLL
jgi:hypothetical protein